MIWNKDGYLYNISNTILPLNIQIYKSSMTTNNVFGIFTTQLNIFKQEYEND